METFLTPQGIMGATIVAFVFGSIYYSPLVFLNVWLKVSRLSQKELPKRKTSYMIGVHFYSLLAHGAMAAVVALMLDVAGVTTLKMALSIGALLSLGFIVTTRYIDMLYVVDDVHYSKQSQIKFLLSSGYYFLTVLIMSIVLFFVASK